jgi:hypothetical protein
VRPISCLPAGIMRKSEHDITMIIIETISHDILEGDKLNKLQELAAASENSKKFSIY